MGKHKELKHESLILQYINNWKQKDFSFGINLCKQYGERLAPGMSFEMLNYNTSIETLKFNEYYLSLYLGFWQLHIGFRK